MKTLSFILIGFFFSALSLIVYKDIPNIYKVEKVVTDVVINDVYFYGENLFFESTEKLQEVIIFNDKNLYSFKLNNSLVDGVNVAKLDVGNYVIEAKTRLFDKRMVGNGEIRRSMYTLTRNNVNKKIDINITEESSSIVVSNSTLPNDIYDVVIDSGHGGSDSGACWENMCEREMMLIYSQILKEKLEEIGLKVGMTRNDNLVWSNEDYYLSPYLDNGRITNAYKMRGKLMISNHLNSYDTTSEEKVRGFEIYQSKYTSQTLSEVISKKLSEISPYSNKVYGEIQQGIYAYTSEDFMFSPFYTKEYIPTDLFYLIRETGGEAIGATLVKERSEFLQNELKYGIQTLLIEYAYMSNTEDKNRFLSKYEIYATKVANALNEYIQKI